MKIEYLDRGGVPLSEREMHIEIENVLNQNEFSKDWKGYASFQLDVRGQERDFDLVLLTEKIIVCVELKNWHGHNLVTSHNDWILDGQSRGRSAYHIIASKVRVLSSALRKNCPKLRNIPPIKGIVVFHGHIDQIHLSDQEKGNVLSKEDFLALMTDSAKFSAHFQPENSYFPSTLYESEALQSFFSGPTVQPRPWCFNGYEIDNHPIFSHPNAVYEEHLAKNADKKTALVRLWNFEQNRFPSLLCEENRKNIALREKLVYEYLHERRNSLHYNMLRPLFSETPSEQIRLDFAEVLGFEMHRPRRLVDFMEERLKRVSSFEERASLLQALMAIIQDFHELGIHHNDLIAKNVWSNEAHEFALTGFYSADLPNCSVVNEPEVDYLDCPDHIPSGVQRDIFALGRMAKEILFARDDIAELPDLLREKYFDFVRKAETGTYFSSVREMLTAFQDISIGTENNCLYSSKDYDAFIRSWDTWYDDYVREGKFLLNTKSLKKYRAKEIDGDKSIIVSIWRLNGGPDELSNEQGAIVLNFLNRLDHLKAANDEHLVRILDFGIAKSENDRLFLIEETTDELDSFNVWQAWHSIGSGLDFEQFRNFSYELIDAYQTHWDSGSCVTPFDGNRILIKHGSKGNHPVLILDHDLSLYADESKESLRKNNLRELFRILNDLSCRVDCEGDSIRNVRRVLSDYLSSEIVTTDLSSLRQALEPPKRSPNMARFDELLINGAEDTTLVGSGPERDLFTIKFDAHRTSADHCIAYLCNATQQVTIDISTLEESAYAFLIREKQERSSSGSLAFSCPRVEIEEGVDGNAYETLNSHPLFASYIKTASKLSPARNVKVSPPELPIEEMVISVRDLWNKILLAEQYAIPSYQVLNSDDHELTAYGKQKKSKSVLHLELDDTPPISRFDKDEPILVLKPKFEGEWGVFGKLDREASKGNNIAVIPNRRSRFNDASKIQLLSISDHASLSRRRQALKEIDSDTTHISNFSSYFEKNSEIEPLVYTDLAITPPSVAHYDKNQVAAFAQVLSHGPISLLQGPPGTGKTRFISGLLIHILTTMPYARVLLTSQSNEAVNNALEQAQELCAKTDIALNAIRLGNIDKVSDDISWYFSDNIRERYRKKLLIEQESRILRFAPRFGLTADFARTVFQLYSEVYPALKTMPFGDDETSDYQKDSKQINQTLKRWCVDHGLEPSITPNVDAQENFHRVIDEVTRIAGVTSEASVHKLTKLIELAFELDTGLTSDIGKYSAFSLKTKSIVAGTLVGLGARNLKLDENTFDWVIVDEASRATASELAIACRVGKRVLLVGDHKQLPPTYGDGVHDALQTLLDTHKRVDNLLISDFERIYQSRYGQSVGCSLITQYRMDPIIGNLVSECFYDGLLTNGRPSRDSAFARELPIELQSSPVVWFDTSSVPMRGREDRQGESMIYNLDEAAAIASLLRKLFSNTNNLIAHKDRNTNEPIVGVICMYRGQIRKITELIKKDKLLMEHRDNIKVDSVDSYQGKENQIVILSTVRSMWPGFLRSDKRINVAISRARDALVIFGSGRLWKEKSTLPLGRVFEHMLENGLPILPFDKLLSRNN